MKHIFVQDHSTIFNSCDKYCHCVHELFYHNSDFYIVTYNKCMEEFNRLDPFFINLIKSIITDSKIAKYNTIVDKSYKVEDCKEWFRNINTMKKYVYEINYLYGTSTRYCIASKSNFFDNFINQDDMLVNYNEVKEYIIKSLNDDSKYLLDRASELFYVNHNYSAGHKTNERFIVGTIDSIIKQINKQIDGNN